ncbi:three-Cys-motif partner protein TcmP [Leptospira sp. 201903071]|uniref:three-Cys-motif partner protein TcmP n=1 Tax=Leptospira ainazelensis TaxID=2810034 RepID=UPI001966199C|nr:three-Cys-motif partner protein TcmP [Leptospira ainazelensis]MBM9499212.1 three-Cys-motif partner protein TcmP [Leptospira ainazelensis]
MPAKDLHKDPFGDSTLTKLFLYRNYLEAWLPTFIMQGQFRTVQVFDFFAGPGYDSAEQPGSPILTLETILQFKNELDQHPTHIILYFNEYKNSKFDSLKKNVTEFLKNHKELDPYLTVKFSNEDFESSFTKVRGQLEKGIPSLLFLDQNGIKFVSESRFQEIIRFELMDFLFFISSAHLYRFSDHDSFLKHLNISQEDLENSPYRTFHRTVVDHFRKLIPVYSNYKIFPFSLKKGPNIHGLIFGASHIAAFYKFLEIAWKVNPINGDANFDIDSDSEKQESNELFQELKLKTKIELFKEQLINKIKTRSIQNSLEIFEFTIFSGHLPIHARDVINSLKTDGTIRFSGNMPISYDAYKRKERKTWELI